MKDDVVPIARATLRNAAGMSIVGLLAKAMGLVVGVLVARYLGPKGLGLFAFLLGLSIIAEQVGSFGAPDVVLRAVGARPATAAANWLAGRRFVLWTSVLPMMAFLVAAILYRHDPNLFMPLILTAVCVPLTAIGNVGQAALQGLGQVGFVTWVNLVSRVASLILLAVLLQVGLSVEAAFLARVAFQGGIMAAYAVRLRQERTADDQAAVASPLLARALPFAGARALSELTLRTPTFVVSSLLGLTATGLYDAADRVSQILQVVIGSGLTALLPLFSRSVTHADESQDAYVRYALKYAVLMIGLAAAGLSALGTEIIAMLYGHHYAYSSSILGILLGAQVLVSADVVVRQSIFAHGRERAAMLTSGATIAILVALAATLATVDGLRGAAVSVLLAACAGLTFDILLARRCGVDLMVVTYLIRPLAACLPALVLAHAVQGWPWPLRLAAVMTLFALGCAVLRVLHTDERKVIAQTLSPLIAAVTRKRLRTS